MAGTRPPPTTATDDQIAWLIDTYGEMLYRVAVAVVRDRHIAEDVVQEVLVKSWTSMPSWDGDVPIRWARTVTKNTALSALRHSSSRPVCELDDRNASIPTVAAADDIYVRSERVSEMWAKLGRLDDESRLLLVLHEVDELSYDEIAETTDLTMSAVKSKIYRARLALRTGADR